MEKYNLLKILDVIYNDTRNTAIQTQIENYTTTLMNMSNDDYKKVETFYLQYIANYFQNKVNNRK